MFSTNLCEVTMDLPPAQDEFGFLDPNLLQAFQLFEWAAVEDLQDVLPGMLQHWRVNLGLPAILYHVLFTIWRLRETKKYSREEMISPFKSIHVQLFWYSSHDLSTFSASSFYNVTIFCFSVSNVKINLLWLCISRIFQNVIYIIDRIINKNNHQLQPQKYSVQLRLKMCFQSYCMTYLPILERGSFWPNKFEVLQCLSSQKTNWKLMYYVSLYLMLATLQMCRAQHSRETLMLTSTWSGSLLSFFLTQTDCFLTTTTCCVTVREKNKKQTNKH